MTLSDNVPLKDFNTFGIEAKAVIFAELHAFPEIQDFLDIMRFREDPLLILGGGSNILFTKDFKGIVVKISTKGIRKISETDDHVFVQVQAGEVWDDFVNYCLSMDYGGIENLALIPGNVGSCPIQNIGAYGVEVKDTIDSVEMVNIHNLQMSELSNSECRFAYRDSIFKHELKGKVIITSVIFKLTKKHTLHHHYGSIQDELKKLGINDPGIKDIARAVTNIRQCKLPDPKVIGNAGSFFKNPSLSEINFSKLKYSYPLIPSYKQGDGTYKIPAGWLIEHCGWKGFRDGDAGVHANQALVLVNYGSANGQQIIELAKKIQQSISEKFGIGLEMEVNIY